MKFREKLGWGLFITLIVAIISIWTGIICSIFLDGRETNSSPRDSPEPCSITLNSESFDDSNMLFLERVSFQADETGQTYERYFKTCIWEDSEGRIYRLFFSSYGLVSAVLVERYS